MRTSGTQGPLRVVLFVVTMLGSALIVLGWGLVPSMTTVGVMLLVAGIWRYSSLRIQRHLNKTYSQIDPDDEG